MTISALPTPPSRAAAPDTFASQADALLGALPVFVTEANALQVDVNALQADVNAKSQSAAQSASNAATQVALAAGHADRSALAADVAMAAANYAGEYDPATTYQVGQSTSYGGRRYAAKTVNQGVTPTDGARWLELKENGLLRSARASNEALQAKDRAALIDIAAGNFTQTFDPCAALGDGWWCYIRNSGTGDITLDPNASETIDGMTSYVMYPGEVRLVQCDGVSLRSIVLNAFYKVFTASGTFTKPPGYAAFEGLLWGAGGGGGYIPSAAYTTGGGGGACVPFLLPVAKLSASTSFSCGAGGTQGVAGGNSVFASITAYGGGPGAATTQITVSGGGGGGALGSGGYGALNSLSAGGLPAKYLTTAGSQHNEGFGGGMGVFAEGQTSGHSAYGGGGGSPPSGTGGSSVFGGGGGAGYNGSVWSTPGASVFGGSGGASNTDGTSPAGGGGATSSFTTKGGNGELRIWGII